ncbi:MAG: PilW family protein [Methylomonas sp.]|nr:PilW family protein [Methylomonas sp.]
MSALHNANRWQAGLTLVEIMIALLIGAFLLGGVLQVFVNSKQTYRMQENLSRLQESGRFAMELISNDLRMAGYVGCASLGAVKLTIDADPKADEDKGSNTNPKLTDFSNSTAITGDDNVAADWNASACSGSCVADTDAVTVQYAGTCGGYLIGNMGTDNANIQIPENNSCGVKANDTLLISDCSAADIFIATNASKGEKKQTIAHAANQNTSPKLSKVYGTDAELYVLKSYSYFIRTGASGRPALWRLDNTKAAAVGTNPVELVEDVENLQILYGEDTDADGAANYYVTADDIDTIANVISLRVQVLVATPDDNLAKSPIKYVYNGETLTPDDRRLRRVFTATLAVRNRLN